MINDVRAQQRKKQGHFKRSDLYVPKEEEEFTIKSAQMRYLFM